MKADLLIKNVEIIDGTGRNTLLGSVAVKDGKICADGDRWECDNVIDGTGLTLAPGFIDVHSHGDFVAGHDYARLCKISQGITTEIAGQCGSSCFPVTPESKELLYANANIVGADIAANMHTFTNLDGYKAYLEKSNCLPI